VESFTVRAEASVPESRSPSARSAASGIETAVTLKRNVLDIGDSSSEIGESAGQDGLGMVRRAGVSLDDMKL